MKIWCAHMLLASPAQLPCLCVISTRTGSSSPWFCCLCAPMSTGRFKSRRCLKVELQKQLLDVFVQVRQSDSSLHQAMAHLVRKFFLEGVMVVVRAHLHHHHFVRTDNSDVNQSKSSRVRPASALPLWRVATHRLVQIINTSLCCVELEYHFWLGFLPALGVSQGSCTCMHWRK